MNQKKSAVFIVLGVILLFIIAGCKGEKGPAGAPTTPFLGGTKGLEIGFIEGMPPDEVTDGKTFEFQAMIRLKNLGEHDLLETDQVKVDLIGILPSDFGADSSELTDREPEDELTARKRGPEGDIIEPTETYIIFPGDNDYFNFGGSIAGNTPFIFRADVCYKYQTDAVSEVCVLGNMIDVADDAICRPSEPKTVFNSGSPVQVTAFRQSVVGRQKIQFSFDIVHSGSGTIFDSTDDADCPKESSSRRTKEDSIMVIVDTGLPGTLNCAGLGGSSSIQRGFVKLVGGKRTITCTQILNEVGDYKKAVDITLEFNYLDSVDKEILVKHLLDEAAYGSSDGSCGDGYCDDTEDEDEDSCPEDCS
ncbi:MAG: hypothetical protein V1831_04440 [Candidatus Woesearchaeota archaeon]